MSTFRPSTNNTALLTIHAFTKSTPDKVKTGLSALPRDAIKALIVDVRGCAGGLFESAVATTGLLLPVGAKVTLVKHRDGSEETLTAKGGPTPRRSSFKCPNRWRYIVRMRALRRCLATGPEVPPLSDLLRSASGVSSLWMSLKTTMP